MPDLRELLRTSRSCSRCAGRALLIANVVAEPNFGKPGNWPEELATLAPFAIVAMASTPAIVSGGGGLDISVGPVAVLANVMLIEWLLPHAADSAWVASRC